MDGLNPQRRSDEANAPMLRVMPLSRATSGLPRSGFVQHLIYEIEPKISAHEGPFASSGWHERPSMSEFDLDGARWTQLCLGDAAS
jgi:hypothetical protein